jgi:hypothetical protein
MVAEPDKTIEGGRHARRRLGSRYRQFLGVSRLGVACLGAAVVAVAVARVSAAGLSGSEGAILYLGGVLAALVYLVFVEALIIRLRIAVAHETARAAARRARARSVQTMMRLGLGPRSEQMF